MVGVIAKARDEDPEITALAVSDRRVATASLFDTMVALGDVILPTLAKGPLIRRRKVVGMAERRHLDDKAVKRLQSLRHKYGDGPLVLSIPFRTQAILLSAEDVRIVLAHSPKPFTAATREKQAALGHFEPNNVLVSNGRARAIRRQLNEQTLETQCERHSLGAHFARVIEEEMDTICKTAVDQGTLDWDTFFTGWMCMVRRIVLGDDARNDTGLTDILEELRYRANFAFLRPKAQVKREKLLDRLLEYVEAAAPHSLIGQMALHCTDPAQMPHHQIPQYLFAFDPGAMASFRTLGLLSVDEEVRNRVSEELVRADEEVVPRLPLLRASLLETLRLWPTTPVILRETTEDVAWSDSKLPAGTHVIIYTPFLHRDDKRLDEAHHFRPDRWIDTLSHPQAGLVPFSYGPVQCPAAHFVPMVASLALRVVLTRLSLRLTEPERLPLERLPGSLDNFTLCFAAVSSDAY